SGSVELADQLAGERTGELPNPIELYPGDSVAFVDDLLAEPRDVTDVHLFEGRIRYAIAPGSTDLFNTMGTRLKLLKGGNVRWLYTDPRKFSFASDREECSFWKQ